MIILQSIFGALKGIGCAIILSFFVPILIGLVVGVFSGGTSSSAADIAFILSWVAIWVVCPAVGFYGPIYTAGIERKKDNEYRLKREEAERKKAEEDRAIELSKLKRLRKNATAAATKMRPLVNAARQECVLAREDFVDRAFAPFWDHIEMAMNHLCEYYNAVNTVSSSASEYNRKRSKLEVSVPGFGVTVKEIPDAQEVAGYLAKIVREAQRDYQFASIYEQRKTNQLLHKGFGTLAVAIRDMESSISSAVDEVTHALGGVMRRIDHSSERQTELSEEIVSLGNQQLEALEEMNPKKRTN